MAERDALTPLDRLIRDEIAANGPMPVSAFMARALGDPEHGYYTTRNPLGADGDFITAPEVSQMFGELTGAWAIGMAESITAAVPDGPVALIELGPGGGTLMADMLRVARMRPDLDARLEVHLIEMSPVLRAQQAEALQAAQPQRPPPKWHDDISDVPEIPFVLVANEFFDALPIEQAVRTETGWKQRTVELCEGELCFGAGPDVPAPSRDDVPDGTIFETCPAAINIASGIARRMTQHPGAALIIDYGYDAPAPGDTLQALRRHERTDPLKNIGESDLTAHVCFGALRSAAQEAGADAHGPITQAAFLSGLGIEARAQRLIEAGDMPRAEIDAALTRLLAPDQMGALFKAMALTSPGAGTPPPFGTGAT